MEIKSFKEKLNEEEYKNTLLILLETQGNEILITKGDLHEYIHEDTIFFLDLIRIYCFKSNQVGVDIKPSFLFNEVGRKICQDTKNSLYISVKGAEETDGVEKEDDFLENFTEDDFENMLNTSSTYNPYEDETKNKKAKQPKKEEKPKEKKDFSATYNIISIYKGNKKESETLYYQGAYTEDRMVKEMPNYFPAGSLDFNTLQREKQLSKQNRLLQSEDIRAITAYFKMVGDTDANAKFREKIQQDSKELRDKYYHKMLDEINEEVVKHWNHYSSNGGLTYEEQRQDAVQIHNKMLNEIADPVDKLLAKEIIDYMNILYKANSNKEKKEPHKE